VSPATRLLRLLWRDTHGSVAIETSLIVSLATMLGFAIFEFSMLAYTYSVLFEAAHEGLRFAEVQGYDAGNDLSGCSTTAPSSVISKVQNVASQSLHNMQNMVVTVCYPDSTGSRPLSRVQITATYSYVPFVQVPGVTQTMSIYSEGRIAY
jgi:Flp pilus assembly protein TadG